jgi:hypothetical protein
MNSYLITYVITWPDGHSKTFVDKWEAPGIGYAVTAYFNEGLTGFPLELNIDNFDIIKVEKVA